MKISLSEVLPSEVHLETLPYTTQFNLLLLLQKINYLGILYGKPKRVTSGYRSLSQHEKIYEAKNKERVSKGLEPIAVPMNSWHLYGAAVDIEDSDGDLKKWCLENLHILEELGLYSESFSSTPGWQHFQLMPPASGKRFFEP